MVPLETRPLESRGSCLCTAGWGAEHPDHSGLWAHRTPHLSPASLREPQGGKATGFEKPRWQAGRGLSLGSASEVHGHLPQGRGSHCAEGMSQEGHMQVPEWEAPSFPSLSNHRVCGLQVPAFSTSEEIRAHLAPRDLDMRSSGEGRAGGMGRVIGGHRSCFVSVTLAPWGGSGPREGPLWGLEHAGIWGLSPCRFPSPSLGRGVLAARPRTSSTLHPPPRPD